MKRLPAVILALWTFPFVARAGEICLAPSAADGRNATGGCDGIWLSNDQVGYRTDGVPTCNTILLCNEYYIGLGWTISSSPGNFAVNSGVLPPEASLYLWLACINTFVGSGMAVAEFDLGATGLNVVDFVPMNGFLNAGTDVNLLLAVGGCPSGPVVAGRIDVENPVSVDAVSWGRIKSSYR